MLKRLFLFYRVIFVRKRFYKFHKLLYQLGLRGLGICNYETNYLSGENHFLSMLGKNEPLVVIDVGANIGVYSENTKMANPKAHIYAFEPQPESFSQLEASALKWNYRAINVALSDREGQTNLYDYANGKGTQHASLYKDVIDGIHKSASICYEVNVQTLDAFVKKSGITYIDLLKIDVEGNEYRVLLGAKNTIAHDMIDLIHFEFNEMNVISQVFFKDFYDLLDNYTFYRMLPDGLINLGDYRACWMEIFAYQNIVAIRNNSRFLDRI